MGGKIRTAYKMSLLGKEMAHLNEELTASEVILNTDKAYVQLVKAKEMKKVAEKYHVLLNEPVSECEECPSAWHETSE